MRAKVAVGQPVQDAIADGIEGHAGAGLLHAVAAVGGHAGQIGEGAHGQDHVGLAVQAKRGIVRHVPIHVELEQAQGIVGAEAERGHIGLDEVVGRAGGRQLETIKVGGQLAAKGRVDRGQVERHGTGRLALEHFVALEHPGAGAVIGQAAGVVLVDGHVVAIGPHPEVGVVVHLGVRDEVGVAVPGAGGVGRGRDGDALVERPIGEAGQRELAGEPAVGLGVEEHDRVAAVGGAADAARIAWPTEAGEERRAGGRGHHLGLHPGRADLPHRQREVDPLHVVALTRVGVVANVTHRVGRRNCVEVAEAVEVVQGREQLGLNGGGRVLDHRIVHGQVVDAFGLELLQHQGVAHAVG